MAQIQTDTVVITFNRLVKNGDTVKSIITKEVLEALEQVAQELVGESIIVEAETA